MNASVIAVPIRSAQRVPFESCSIRGDSNAPSRRAISR